MTETATPTSPLGGSAAARPDAGELPTQYDPAAVEVALYQRWEQAGYFTADPDAVISGHRRPFSMVLPPPNVTGNLHLGHALDHTLMDVLARWHRMSGDEVLWLPGMDHAGIATQTVVEKQLAVDGKTRHDFGRDLFVQKVWDWKHESGGAILGQMRRLGDSVDWSRERFTLDDQLSRVVQTVFKAMYDDGLIYRAERIINWCPGCLTAISDIEVDYADDPGELVSVRYDGDGFSIVVATTRVETMLGDTGIAVHPDDERYRDLVGRTVTLPLVGRPIPIVADAHVDPAFGTGAVKVTPAHDPNDFEIGRRHDLAVINVLTDDARIVGTGTAFDTLDRFAARRAVKAALAAEGRVVGEVAPYVHSVGHCSRSDDVIEPRLSLQWFVRVTSLARAAADAVRDGRTTIHPQELAPRYFQWVDNMHDWTISRQLWWGHRIPVWYGPDGQVRCVGPDEPLPGEGWTQDPDVLDTWFSSGLWPFSTMGWPQRTPTLQAFYPTSVLVTGYDILFFWVARMMMFGRYVGDGSLLPTDSVPFEAVALHGLVRDQFGKKMSKSRGNVVDPLPLIDEFGADALRLTLVRGANPGRDQAFAVDWVRGAKAFCSKLFNATRFALLNGAAVPDAPLTVAELATGTPADRWICAEVAGLVERTTALLADFQFAQAAEGLYHFAWDEFCDWYLELAKPQLRGDGAALTRRVLGQVLDVLLRLLHPFVPFVTETLWTRLTGRETVVTAAWPRSDGIGSPAADLAAVADLQALVTELRRFRSEQAIPPARRLPADFTWDAAGSADPASDWLIAAAAELARLDLAGQPGATANRVEIALRGGVLTATVDTTSELDVGAERARLERGLGPLHKELDGTARQLADPAFLGRAPEPVVAKIRARHAAATAEIARVTARLAELDGAR